MKRFNQLVKLLCRYAANQSFFEAKENVHSSFSPDKIRLPDLVKMIHTEGFLSFPPPFFCPTPPVTISSFPPFASHTQEALSPPTTWTTLPPTWDRGAPAPPVETIGSSAANS